MYTPGTVRKDFMKYLGSKESADSVHGNVTKCTPNNWINTRNLDSFLIFGSITPYWDWISKWEYRHYGERRIIIWTTTNHGISTRVSRGQPGLKLISVWRVNCMWHSEVLTFNLISNKKTRILLHLHKTHVSLLQARYLWLPDDWRRTFPKSQ